MSLRWTTLQERNEGGREEEGETELTFFVSFPSPPPPFRLLLRFPFPGSGWNEYKKSGTVHGIQLPEGLVESQKLPEPLFTPSTKADQGDHDENIHPSKGELLSLSSKSFILSSTRFGADPLARFSSR